MKYFQPLLTYVFIVLAITISHSGFAQSDFSSEQKKQIQLIVRDYLVSNPQVLSEAARALQQQEVGQIQKQAQQAVASYAKQLFNSAISPQIGKPDGTVTLVEFTDYQCPYCKRMVPAMVNLAKTDAQLRIIIKELPIFGATSQYAAQAALAAQKQGKYLEFHEALMKTSGQLSEDKVMAIAKSAGLDTAKLKNEMIDKSINKELETNFMLANALGVRGTPSFVIATNIGDPASMRSYFIPGAASEKTLQDIITAIRKK